jgi:TetR/AcrR family transcriptional repressor of mexJK operon
MGVITKNRVRRPRLRGDEAQRGRDPRVIRTRAAVIGAARELFLDRGFARTAMDDIAAAAGVTKRTLYNNFSDKNALFTEIVSAVIAQAETFAGGLQEELAGTTAANLVPRLYALGERLVLNIIRPEVITLRRLVIGEAREFPSFAAEYFDRAPGQVLEALASAFARLGAAGLLRVDHPRIAAAHFAYLVAGESLDRAVLVGTPPSKDTLRLRAREGADTFLARYAVSRRRKAPTR